MTWYSVNHGASKAADGPCSSPGLLKILTIAKARFLCHDDVIFKPLGNRDRAQEGLALATCLAGAPQEAVTCACALPLLG